MVEFIQNFTRAWRDSYRDGTNTLSRNASFNQPADEGGRAIRHEFVAC